MIGETDRLMAGYVIMRSVLRQYALGMALLALALFMTSEICEQRCNSGLSSKFAALAIFALLGMSVCTVFSLMYHDANTLWTPAVLFPLSTALYFGFGSMSVLFSSTSTRRFLMGGNYAIDGVGLLRTLMLTSFGVAIVTMVMVFAMRLRFGSRREVDHRRGGRLPLAATAVFFTVAGVILKYGLVLPAQYGLIDLTIPGSLKALTGLVDLGLAVMMFMAARGQRIWVVIFFLIWPIHLGLSTLEFSKRVVMFAILLPAAGAYLGHQNWRRLIPWVFFAAVIFNILQDVNTAARLTLLQQTGSIGSDTNLYDRFNLMGEILEGNVQLEDLSSTARVAAQVWWLRLNYSGAQLRAMELYDDGRPGEWTLSVAQILVPRFLWPDKPESVSQGRIFNRIVSGREDAQTRIGISIYADGYWQLGWLGVILFSVIAGFCMGIVCRLNYRFILRRELLYLPMIFLGMRMAALGPMGYLQKNFVAAMPIYLGYFLLIYVLQTLLRTSPAGGPGRAATA